jgi:hypothetical protein
MTDWVQTAANIIVECSFPGFTFSVIRSNTTTAVYLQGSYEEADTVSGTIEKQHTRRWFLSPEMSRSEIVSTALKCVLTSMEHRTREWFIYNGRAIYQPHYDVDALWEICEERQVRTSV